MYMYSILREKRSEAEKTERERGRSEAVKPTEEVKEMKL